MHWSASFIIAVVLSMDITLTSEITEETNKSSQRPSPLSNGDNRDGYGNNSESSSICSVDETSIKPERCPSDHECSKLDAICMICNCSSDCQYGKTANASCTVPQSINCTGARNFNKPFTCQYCYQSNASNHKCSENFECNSVADPNSRLYLASCAVPDALICLGNRKFLKLRPCNWTGGYKWTTALALSITLGGFGADRFYLGHWQEGIGKLFSFGGLGVWTLVDVVMVAIRYIGPADGSLYI